MKLHISYMEGDKEILGIKRLTGQCQALGSGAKGKV